jgi:hypothetical protein
MLDAWKEKRVTMIHGLVMIFGLATWGFVYYIRTGDDKPNELLVHIGKTGATIAGNHH